MSRPQRPARRGAEGQVRIVGGRWRNTRLAVPSLTGLRPSSDRVRETLFNWLMPRLPGARVLDLFAGSGALGLEAVSRGAGHATLIERDSSLVQRLRAHVTRLDAATQVQVLQEDAVRWLERAPAALADIVFVDPPFAACLWPAVLERLPRMWPPMPGCIWKRPPMRRCCQPAGICTARAPPARCAMRCTAGPLLHWQAIRPR